MPARQVNPGSVILSGVMMLGIWMEQAAELSQKVWKRPSTRPLLTHGGRCRGKAVEMFGVREGDSENTTGYTG
jgi:hypothetical protein